MYNLLVRSGGWADNRDSIPRSRLFEYTDTALSDWSAPNGVLNVARMVRLPALLMPELDGDEPQYARVGAIRRIQERGSSITVEYDWDEVLAPIDCDVVASLAADLQIEGLEFTRTHWAIKDVELYKVLLHNQTSAFPTPRVFALSRSEVVDPRLVSVMMPFSMEFNEVSGVIRATCDDVGLRCLRADDIWENDAVIQDIVSLINRSKVVICDCTGRNANVFYEIGIAHTLGRDVILITQNGDDIPFDLRHLRYITYLNNQEGRKDLAIQVRRRLERLSR